MRKALILILGLLLSLLFILPARYVYVCEIMDNCELKDTVDNDRTLSLALMDGDSAILKGYEQLAFDLGSISPNLTLNNQAFLDKIAEYLKVNREKYLTITGLYRNAEKGKSSGMYENLGIARANRLRDFLVKRGIDVNRITLDHSALANDNLTEPAKFDLYIPRPEDYEEDGALVKTQFRFDNMTFSDVNFEFDSDVFKPGQAFSTWADSVSTYFELNTDKTLSIIGHTDNVGTAQYNQDLGLRRAQSAKAFFETKGLKIPIKSTTRGEKSPVSSNATKEGQQKNRRVNFIFN